MYYAGESNVPGAPGNLNLFGAPQVTRQPMPMPNQHAPIRHAGLMSGAVPMGNAGFFAGPQLGQALPAGYTNKTVS